MKKKKRNIIVMVLILVLGITNTMAQINAPSNAYFLCKKPYNNLDIFWTDASNNETGFIVESKLDGGSWNIWQTINTANANTYGWLNYDRSQSREFRIIAFNASGNSAPSNTIRVVGTNSLLEVYPEVPGIRNPQILTINSITFPEIQYQCPAEPSKGFATRVSTFYKVQVRPSSGGNWLSSPTYETRPQIRNNKAQNDPEHSNGGHSVYAYGNYGPSTAAPTRTLHSRHWNNFDTDTEVIVRVELLSTALSQTINLSELEIYPAPIAVSQVNPSTVDITLPASGNGSLDFAKHYMVTFNRTQWRDPSRGSLIYEHPLMLFVNPVKPAPASAPDNTYKEFNTGKLLVLGAGIHLPNNRFRFFGSGENNSAEEVYVPGDAYMHGGFVFNSTAHPVRVWGRGIYSDELFRVHDPTRNLATRTPWANLEPCEGNTWNIKGTWEASVLFEGSANQIQTLEGLSSISRRMGTASRGNANAQVIDHKDVAYAGGLYQQANAKTYYLGIYTHNDDDITYCHEDYEMYYSTSRNFHNGPSFQFGWGVDNEPNALGKTYNHTTLPSDKLTTSFGENHGVFNSRLQSGNLIKHFGGFFENFNITGQENIVFNIGISNNDNRITKTNPVSIFGDKTFKNFTIEKHSRNDNLLETKVKVGTTWKSYMRFIHFDNLVIEGNHVNNIDDGDFFDYNEKINDVNNMDGVLLHTITFFSLPSSVSAPTGSTAAIGQTVNFKSKLNLKMVVADASLPVSLSPLCANSNDTGYVGFQVVDAGNGYIAFKAPNGYFVKADPKRYGYIYTEPDLLRNDPNTTSITEDAKFVWEDLGNDEFALYSKTMGLYVRTEINTGSENPLYAASATVGNAETFSTNLLLSTKDNAFLKLNIYPNPARSEVTVTNLQGAFSYNIYNVSGKLLKTKANQVSKSIDISYLSSGLYFLEIADKNNIKSTIKLLKE